MGFSCYFKKSLIFSGLTCWKSSNQCFSTTKARHFTEHSTDALGRHFSEHSTTEALGRVSIRTFACQEWPHSTTCCSLVLQSGWYGYLSSPETAVSRACTGLQSAEIQWCLLCYFSALIQLSPLNPRASWAMPVLTTLGHMV